MDAAKQKVLQAIDGMRDEIVETLCGAVRIPSVNPKYPGQDYDEGVGGEEVMDHLAGVTAVARRYRADAAIVSEPTAPPAPLAIVPVTPGLWWMSITCRGKPVHASVRDELIRAGGRGAEIGVNAIEKGIYIYQAVRQLEEQWGQSKRHPLFKPGHFVMHPGVIQGGPQGVMVPFIVSEFCTIEYSV